MDAVTAYWPGFALAYGTFLLSIMSPGPNILAIMGTSMSVGRKAGAALAMGVATGSFCWAVLAATGLTALLATYAEALIVIKVVGGAFLLWLAWKAFKAAASRHDISAQNLDGPSKSYARYFLHGLVVQMTNPKAALAWIAIVSLGLGPNAPAWVAAFIVAGTTIFSIVIHLAYAFLFSMTRMVHAYGRARRWIQGALGVFFTIAGIRLLTARL